MEEMLLEVQTLVDNFDRIEKLMEFQSPDDFYFVQIIQRKKDNPNNDTRQGNYHAGAWYLGGYRIHSAQELEAKKNEIIQMCHTNNARAYITVNSRSDAETDKQIIKMRTIYPSYDARNKFADQIVPGQAKDGYNWRGQRLRFFIDIDSPNKKIWDECLGMIQMCGIQILDKYETPSGGLHIILPSKEDKNIDYLKHLLTKFDRWMNKGRMALCHPNMDGKLILYSNVQTAGY